MGSANYSVLITPKLDTGAIQKQLDSLKVNWNISPDSSTTKSATAAGKTVGKAVSDGANKEVEKSFGETLVKTLKNRLMYAAVDTAISAVTRGMADAVANVIELDASLTELKKVTNFTAKELDGLTDSAYEVGTSVGRTGDEMVQAATEFAKMNSNYSQEQLLKLAKVASMYQNIADSEVSASDAASLINSQIKAFGLSINDAESVIDKINEVSNNFAVSSTDISNALTKTSSAMATYGNDINQTIAIVTAGTEVMTGQASKVARGWRTIGANITKLAKEEDTWSAANGKVSVSLKDENGDLRSTYDILNDLYPQWQNLTKAEKSSLALSIAGKSHLEVFTATMNNFSNAIKANATAQGAAGSASKENAKYLDSIEGRMSKLRSAWEQLSKDLVNSDLIKAVVSGATIVLKILDKIISTIGALPGSLLIITGVVKGISKLSKAMAALKASQLGASVIENILGKNATGAVSNIEKVSAAIGGASGKGGLIKNIIEAKKQYKLLQLASLDARTNKKIADDINSARKALGGIKKEKASEELAKMTESLSKLKVLGGTLAGLAAGIAVIAGMKFADDIYQETYGFSSNVEKANKTSKELTKTQKQIDELLEKQNNSAEGLTAKEKRQLQILQAEESSLKRQLKLYEDRAKKAASKEAKKEFKSYESPSGGITASEANVGDVFLASGDKIKEQRIYIKQLNATIDDLLERRQEYIEQGKDTSEIDEEITDYNTLLESAKSAMKGLKEEQKELAGETIQRWEEMKAEFGDYYKSLDKESKAAYDNLHRQAILALDGVKDEVANLASDMVSLFGSNTYDAFDLDLTSFQSAEELTQAISDKLATMGDKQIKLYARDEAGNIIDTVKVKASELSAKEWQLIIDAQTSGDWDKVEEYKNLNPNQKKFAEVVTTVKKDQSGIANLFSKEQLNPKVTVKYQPNYAAITSRNSKIINTPITQWVTYRATNKKKAKGKRKGEEGGTAWLGDEGNSQNPKPELVVGKNGAYLAGTSGWELFNLDNSDTVYSYSQTKKLLGNNLNGSDNASPMYASGTNNEAFDNALEELEYKRDVNHWTDEYYAQQYRALYNRYGSGSLSTSQAHSYGKYIEEVATNKAKAEIERLQGVLEETGEGLTELVNKISKDSHFNADEKQELLEEAYQASVKYNTEEYKNGKDTRAKILEDIKAYYKVRGAYDEEYYSMLNDLREADQDLEVERLETLSDVEDKKLSLAEKYLQQQLDLINKQIKANEDEADSMEDLKDLQQDLADARSDMVKIYREGVGWVYEQNSEAIKEAQDAIEDYNKEHMSDELQAQADALETIIDLFDEMQDLSDIKELELALGVNSLTELTSGDFGTNIKLWTEWIKNAIATQVGLEDLSTQIKNATGTGIDEWLGDVFSSGSHQASSSAIASYIAKHSFASGTLSASGGLSLVGEHGAELTWLNKGSAVFPNTVSRNLMQWGTYSPAQLLSGVNNSTTQTFNFKEIVLPNVKNADDFYKELQRLPNMAIQKSAQRA